MYAPAPRGSTTPIPLPPPRAAATTQPARLHELDDVDRRHLEGPPKRPVASGCDVTLELDHRVVAPVRRDHAHVAGHDGSPSRPARTREACRKSRTAGPRAGS